MRILFIIGIFVISCATNNGFKSQVLTSSKGELIFINSYNYGITGDNQLTVISKDKDKLKYNSDTSDAVSGLNPFIYSFKNDTLTLIFNDTITYVIKEEFETINVVYKKISNSQYMDFVQRAVRNDGFHQVPDFRENNIIDIPKPPLK